ncbi:hypothetical protein EV356DRAFT_530756 [Viridothelium virens]|uniref:Uncharacterized protein n=1 Tax=Viridothelium virens TaxID=1048519 RepID=A0A6A6HFP3_VIRVR|nr:hypothetical protein EV356DRAFT_530756 [Viridothelium virens]
MITPKETQPLSVHVSSYNEKRGKWALDVLGTTVENDEIFQAELREHEVGSANGLPSVIIRQGQPFPFTCLPPEVRNLVYDHLFPRINVSYYKLDGDNSEDDGEDEGEGEDKDEGEEEDDDEDEDEDEAEDKDDFDYNDKFDDLIDMTREEFFSNEHLAITQVSREIRREIMPIVLGNTRWFFPKIYHFHAFIGRLQDLRIYLRQLQIFPGRDERMNALFRALVDCTRLERLCLTYDFVGTLWQKTGELYEDAKPWIYTLALARGKKKAALDILTVEGSVQIGQLWQRQDEHSPEEFEEELRTHAARDPVLKNLFSKHKSPAAAIMGKD